MEHTQDGDPGKQLVVISNGRPMADSRVVAERFGKRHKDVLRKIDRLIATIPDLERNFALSFYSYAGAKGAQLQAPFYLMDQTGFSILAHKFTGEEALRWTVDYVRAFEAMQDELAGRPADPALTYERQKDMILTVKEAFGEDDARSLALSYGWAIKKRRPRALPSPAASRNDPLTRVVDAGIALLRHAHDFTLDEACMKAGIVPRAVDAPGQVQALEQSWQVHGIYGVTASSGCRRYRKDRVAI